MYNTVIFPIMAFGLKVTTLTRANRRKLRLTERSCLRILLKFSYNKNNRNTQARQFLKGRTVTRRIKVMKICFWGHIKRRPANHMLQLSAKLQNVSKKKKIGRPSFTDRNGMKEAFSKYKHSSEFWENKAANKIDLKKEAERIFEECFNDTSSSGGDTVLSDGNISSTSVSSFTDEF